MLVAGKAECFYIETQPIGGLVGASAGRLSGGGRGLVS